MMVRCRRLGWGERRRQLCLYCLGHESAMRNYAQIAMGIFAYCWSSGIRPRSSRYRRMLSCSCQISSAM